MESVDCLVEHADTGCGKGGLLNRSPRLRNLEGKFVPVKSPNDVGLDSEKTIELQADRTTIDAARK